MVSRIYRNAVGAHAGASDQLDLLQTTIKNLTNHNDKNCITVSFYFTTFEYFII